MPDAERRKALSRSVPILLAVWFALAGGLMEAALLLGRRHLLGRILHLGQDAVWLAAIANLSYVILPAAALAVAWNRIPARGAIQTAIFTPALIAWSGVALFSSRIHWAAALLIGVGLALRSTSIIGSRPALALGFVRRTLPILVVLVGLFAVGTRGARWWREWRAEAVSSPATRQAPNILLLVLDTSRWSDFGVAGYSRPTTPMIDRRAAEGAVFDQAMSTAPWTLPGHASIMTARWPMELKVDLGTPLDRTFPTVAEVLRARGWATGGFVANTTYCSYEYGLDRGFDHYRDYSLSFGNVLASSALGRRLSQSGWVRRWLGYYEVLGRKSAAGVNGELLEWLDGLGDRPFFAFANYFDAHEPYLPPQAFDRFGTGAPRKLWELKHVNGMAALPFKEVRPAVEMQREHDAYDAALAYLDSEIGRLFDALEQRGLLDKTLVVLTGDHGEQFGEHGLFEHGNGLYRPVMQVPLILRWPGHIPVGRRVHSPVSVRDIPATILAAIGPPRADSFPGNPLQRFLTPRLVTETIPDPIFMDYGSESGKPERGVIAGGWKYIVRAGGREELYDFASDPAETENLAGLSSRDSTRAVLRWLADSLRDAIRGKAGAGPR